MKDKMTVQEAKAVVESVQKNWPFTRISPEQVRKVEQANRIINQKELHSEESPF